MLYQPEFNDVQRVRELLSFFEQNDIFRLVENTQNQGLSVTIGKENQIHLRMVNQLNQLRTF